MAENKDSKELTKEGLTIEIIRWEYQADMLVELLRDRAENGNEGCFQEDLWGTPSDEWARRIILHARDTWDERNGPMFASDVSEFGADGETLSRVFDELCEEGEIVSPYSQDGCDSPDDDGGCCSEVRRGDLWTQIHSMDRNVLEDRLKEARARYDAIRGAMKRIADEYSQRSG